MSDAGSHSCALLDVLRQIGLHDHLALIYDGKEEQFAAAIPALWMGIDRREKYIYVADENTARDVIDSLRDDGIDVGAAIASRNVTVAPKQNTVQTADFKAALESSDRDRGSLG
jgi:hypothetical protein